MNVYRIEAQGEARELYDVEAATEEEAREMFANGGLLPFVSEVTGSEIVSIECTDTGGVK